jgi:hypothetical protein
MQLTERPFGKRQTKPTHRKGGEGTTMRSDSHLDKLFRKPRYTLYHPAMSEENVRRLYHLKLEVGRPMTKLLDQILNEYFEEHAKQHETKEGGKTECMNVKSAETHLKSNGSKKEAIVTTLATRTVLTAGASTTPLPPTTNP